MKKKLRLKKGVKISLFLIPIIILIIVVLTLYFKYKNNLGAVNPNNKDKKTVEFEVKLGSNPKAVAKRLKEEKLIKSEKTFLIRGKRKNYSSKLKAGNYLISDSDTVDEIWEKLMSGVSTNIKLRILEGWGIDEIALEIEKITNHKKENFLKLAKDREFAKEMASKYDFIELEMIMQKGIRYPLEGYLFPDTYFIDGKDFDLKKIFMMMLSKMDQVLNKELKRGSDTQFLSTHEVLTIASIVEREAHKAVDKKKVAYLFIRRLEMGMPLGSDVTTYYGLGIPIHSRELTIEELNRENPYNTRSSKVKYPVGPIGSPGKTSIDAVYNPIKHDYLYFVSDKNFDIYYAKTNRENLNKVAELKKAGLWFVHE